MANVLGAMLGGMLAMPQATAPRILVGGNKQLAPRVQKVADGLNMPLPNWSIVVLDHDQWVDWSKHNPNASKTDGAFSLLGTGRTYLDQDWLTKHPDERLRNNLAHEMGHLVSNSPREDVAEHMKDQFFKTQSWSALK